MSRPSSLPSTTHKVVTGCGSAYVTVGLHEGKLFEVFITRGHVGNCTFAMNEALGRTISIGLQNGVPVEDYVKTLLGIKCEKIKLGHGDDKCESCADGLAKVLKQYCNST